MWKTNLYTNQEIHILYQLQSASQEQAQSRYLQLSWTLQQYILDSLPEKIIVIRIRNINTIGIRRLYLTNGIDKFTRQHKIKINIKRNMKYEILQLWRKRKLIRWTYTQDRVTPRLNRYMQKWVYTWVAQHICYLFQVL